MRSLCPAIKRDGTRCTLTVPEGKGYCYHHDPERSATRSRASSTARKSRPDRELREIKTTLLQIVQEVRQHDPEVGGGLPPGNGSVMVQALNTYIRVVEQERKVREQEELMERLERLERGTGGAA